MTLCRRNAVYLNQKGELYSIEYPGGTITVTCKAKANRIFDRMTLAK